MSIEIKFIHPPNWNVTEQQIEGSRRVVIRITETSSDGNEESGTKVLDISTLLSMRGLPVIRTVLEKYSYDIRGFTNLKLEWDRDPNALMLLLPGSNFGKGHPGKAGGIVDPDDGTGGSGDILLTTIGADSGDSYWIELELKLKDSAPAPIGA